MISATKISATDNIDRAGNDHIGHTSATRNVHVMSQQVYMTSSARVACTSLAYNNTSSETEQFELMRALTFICLCRMTSVMLLMMTLNTMMMMTVIKVTGSLAIANRPCDYCITLKSGFYTKAI